MSFKVGAVSYTHLFVLLVSEGNNYTSSVVSIRFGSELAHILNERLNQERWALIVGDGASAASPGATTLREGLDQVREGAAQLHSGAVEAKDVYKRQV